MRMSRKVWINTKIGGGPDILRSGCLFEVCTPLTSSTSSSASHSALVLVPPPTHTVPLSRARNSRQYRPCQSHPIAHVSSSHHLSLFRTCSSRFTCTCTKYRMYLQSKMSSFCRASPAIAIKVVFAPKGRTKYRMYLQSQMSSFCRASPAIAIKVVFAPKGPGRN